MDELRLSLGLYEELIAHALAHYPEEACGLVAGSDGRATRFYPIENSLHSPTAYEMEPRQQVRAMLAMDTEGLELVAICHSHPTSPARPSVTDIAQAYYPDAVHLIISLADPKRPVMRGFMIQDGKVREIRVAWIA